MNTVRPITWAGFGLGLTAFLLISVDVRVAAITGLCGVAVSLYALLTSK